MLIVNFKHAWIILGVREVKSKKKTHVTIPIHKFVVDPFVVFINTMNIY